MSPELGNGVLVRLGVHLVRVEGGAVKKPGFITKKFYSANSYNMLLSRFL
jgi:hypothetical protein